MRVLALFLLFLLCQCGLAADAIPPGGTDLITSQSALVANPGKDGKAAKVPVTEQSFTQAQRLNIVTATPGKPWSAQFIASCPGGSIKQGDSLLITYMARSLDGGKGKVIAKLQHTKPPFEMIGMTEPAIFAGQWEQVFHVLRASQDAPQGVAELTLFLGEQVQTVEITELRVLDYGQNYDLAKLPHQKITYDGRDADAPWRKAALERIEKLRTADFAVKLLDAGGKPLANKEVTVETARLDFGFGSCLNPKWLNDKGPDGDKYRDIVSRTCSKVVFEDALKPGLFPEDKAGQAELLQSFDWLKQQGIVVRGHYLTQDAVDQWARAQLGDPAKLHEAVLASVRERVAFVGDRVVEWDAINHPIAWHGAERMRDKSAPLNNLSLDVWREARTLTKLPLCINEDQLFRPGKQQDGTYDLLKKLKDEGVAVDGLGNQAHIHVSYLPTPEDMLRITDRFATVVPKQVITEYDISANGDDQLAADYLRDSLIVCFSHPAYDGFVLWGFWEGSHWKPEAALWRKDWSIKPQGQVWEDWVGKRWHTKLTLKTDDKGVIQWHGYKGTYRIGPQSGAPAVIRPGSLAMPMEIKLSGEQ